MTFDPAPYFAGIKRLNEAEREHIKQRATEARVEAARFALPIKDADNVVRSVTLFGSLASGTPTNPDFDIDLAIEGGDSYAAMDIVENSSFNVDSVNLERLPVSVQERVRKTGIYL